MTMTLDQFRATHRSARPTDLPEIAEYLPEGIEPAGVHFYADGYTIHEAEGQFWVHAWWYRPAPYATLAEAEEHLHPWYLEFN